MSVSYLQTLEQLVPPLHGCTLCMFSKPIGGQLHCDCPAVRTVHGLQPVRVVRAAVDACGPGATHMDMAAWRRA